YLPEKWLLDAARRVCQIQQVTHALKFTHPDAKGSSLNSAGNSAAGEHQVGTHSIGDQLASDIVGNAAALDVYKFLSLSIGGKSLLDYACMQHPALAAALSNDAEQAGNWMAAFSSLAQPKGKPASHKLAKQVYWPLDNGEYHLLAPLFPTSLVHGVWKMIREDLFSETTKAAREAHRAGVSHLQGYHE
ncbi:CRISPR-associated protein Csy1, partial [mine drainage metagenome]